MLTLKNTHTAIHDGAQQPRRSPRDAERLLRRIALPQHHARRLPAADDPALQRQPAAYRRHLRPHQHARRPIPGKTPARWARLPDEWCAERDFDPAAQTSVNLFRCLWEFDLMTEAYQLRRSLGRALQFRADVRRLAALTVYGPGQRFALALDARDRLHRDAFRGGAPAHQRRR